MAKEVSQFELLFIIKPEGEAAPVGVVGEVRALIEAAAGKVLSEDDWGRRSLAYEINGEYEGFYYVWQLELPAAKVNLLKNQLRLKDSVLRYLLVS